MGGLFLALSEMQSHYAPAILSQLTPCSPVPLSAQAERDAEMDGHHFCLFIFLALPKVALKSHQWTNLSLSPSPDLKRTSASTANIPFFPKRMGRGVSSICFLRLHLLKLSRKTLAGASCRLNIYQEIDINGQRRAPRPLSSAAKWTRQRI